MDRHPSKSLIYTIKNAKFEKIPDFIRQGADVNHKMIKNETPLYLVANEIWRNDEDSCEAVKILLEAGANPKIGYPLPTACAQFKLETFKALLEGGADINTTHPSFGSVLFIAGSTDMPEFIKIALEHKAKINISHPIPRTYYSPPVAVEGVEYQLMFMYAAGEKYPFLDSMDKHVPTTIFETRKDISLKNLCRKAIRTQAIKCTNENLFEVSTKLGLPKLMQNYLVFDLTVTMTIDEFYDTCIDTFHPDAQGCQCDTSSRSYTESDSDSDYPDSLYEPEVSPTHPF